MDATQREPMQKTLEQFRQRRIDRREALRLLALLTGSTALGSSILAACSPARESGAPPGAAGAPPPAAPTATSIPVPTPTPVPASAADVQFPGQAGTLFGHLARPAGAGPFPAVLVCPENDGLRDHFKDVARRLSNEGYVGLAVDPLSREGGIDKVPRGQLTAIMFGPPERHIQDFQAALRYLQSQAYVRADRIGMMGFCVGGQITWLMAARTPELRAAVPFYGASPKPEEVANIRAAVLGIYGEQDRFINPGIPAIEAAMAQQGKVFEKEIYVATGHSFFQDDKPQAYNAEAARAAWTRTLAWFEKYLRA